MTQTQPVSQFIANLADLKQWRFQLGEEEVSGELLGAPDFMLPAVLWYADKLYRTAFEQRELGVRLEPNEGAFLGVRASQPEGEVRSSVLNCFVLEGLRRIIETEHPELEGLADDAAPGSLPPVQLDRLMLEFITDLAKGETYPQVQLPQRVIDLASNPGEGARSWVKQ